MAPSTQKTADEVAALTQSLTDDELYAEMRRRQIAEAQSRIVECFVVVELTAGKWVDYSSCESYEAAEEVVKRVLGTKAASELPICRHVFRIEKRWTVK